MKHATATNQFTLKYWRDGDWYVGQLLEVPSVISQGETLEDLQENIIDAYKLVMLHLKETSSSHHPRSRSKPIEVPVLA